MHSAIEQANGKYRIANANGRNVDIAFTGMDPLTIDEAHSHHTVRTIDPSQITVVPYVAPTPYDGLTLDEAREYRIKLIDAKTVELITAGFSFDGASFSMSESAQRNWAALGAANANGLLSFPLPISTVDEGSYTLTDATALLQFLGAYLTYQVDPTQPLGTGRSLKAQINACETIDAIKAVEDNR